MKMRIVGNSESSVEAVKLTVRGISSLLIGYGMRSKTYSSAVQAFNYVSCPPGLNVETTNLTEPSCAKKLRQSEEEHGESMHGSYHLQYRDQSGSPAPIYITVSDSCSDPNGTENRVTHVGYHRVRSSQEDTLIGDLLELSLSPFVRSK